MAYDPYSEYVTGAVDPTSGPAPVAPTTAPMASGALPPQPSTIAASLPQNVSPPMSPGLSPTGVPIAQANDPNYQMGGGSPSGQMDSGGGYQLPQPYQGPALRGGPIKNVLTRMLYGLGQQGIRLTGQPTDYEIQKRQFDQQLQANNQRIAQMRAASEAQLQQAQVGQYRFGQQMVDTPLGPMPQQTWQKIAPAFVTGQAGIKKEEIATQGRFDVEGMKAMLATGVVAAYKDSYDENGRPGVQMLNKYGQPMGFVPGAVAKSFATSTSTTEQHLQAQDGTYHVFTVPTTKTPGNLPAYPWPGAGTAPPTLAPAAGTPSFVPAAGGAPPAANLPPSARSRIPPSSTAGKTLGTGQDKTLPFQGPNASKWMVGTEPGTNRMVAVPAGDVARYGLQNVGNLDSTEQTSMLNARQAYQNYTKIGDPNKPETQGVLQLINSLDKDGKLGVVASRFNSLMTKGVGTSPGDDPRIITLLDKNHLGATKTMMAHIGKARSPQAVQMFLDMADAGKMDGPTLKAGTLALSDYMKDAGYVPSGPSGGAGNIRARDPNGVLHEAPAGTVLPKGWTLEK